MQDMSICPDPTRVSPVYQSDLNNKDITLKLTELIAESN